MNRDYTTRLSLAKAQERKLLIAKKAAADLQQSQPDGQTPQAGPGPDQKTDQKG